jgi:hypothetical protein
MSGYSARMDFIHTREWLSGGDTVVVKITHQCNVRLMDDANFQKYKNGLKYESVGGFYKTAPIKVQVPHLGHWNITIDLGPGKTASGIKYHVSFLKS